MTIEELKPVVDALIFASDTPLSVQKIKQILDDGREEGVPARDIKAAIDAINSDNRDSQRGFFLQEVAGGYQYRTRPNYAGWVKKLKKIKPFRLTQSTLEVLAIISYKQPLIRAEIEKIRGVDSGGVIKNLLERNLIKIVGRKNIPGRPFLFSTTKRFLEMFGLERLSDLPSLKDISQLDDSKLPTILQDTVADSVIEIQEEDRQDQQVVTDDDLQQAEQRGAGIPDDVSEDLSEAPVIDDDEETAEIKSENTDVSESDVQPEKTHNKDQEES